MTDPTGTDGVPLLALVTATGAWETDDDAVPLVDALAAIGIEASAAVWDDAEVDWAAFDLVVLRSPWDYTERVDEFLTWAARVESTTPLLNPADVLAWNTDKRYLGELAGAGLSVVPTSYLLASDPTLTAATTGTTASADTTRREVEDRLPHAGRFVVKPTVSSGSRDTARYEVDQRAEAAAHATQLLSEGRDVMVQPYVESVDEAGETGMLFFDGEFSHGFRKGALLTGGAARVEGLYAREEIAPRDPSEAELDLARAVLAWVEAHFGGRALTYARIDVLAGPDGRPMLLELELTEPSYFLATGAGSPARAARAYAAALERLRRRAGAG